MLNVSLYECVRGKEIGKRQSRAEDDGFVERVAYVPQEKRLRFSRETNQIKIILLITKIHEFYCYRTLQIIQHRHKDPCVGRALTR